MWKENALIQRLRIRFPIIQAPMAGVSMPQLVAAVSNAGGLGSLGAAYLSPLEIKEAIDEIRSLTDQPFAVNLFAREHIENNETQIQKADHHLNKYRTMLGIPSVPSTAHLPKLESQIEVICQEKVPIFSFTFGILDEQIMARIKRQDTFVIGTATTLDEALLLQKSGVDAVVAQGYEAGGHRGAFDRTRPDPCLGTLAMLPQIVHACKIPVIAAGGIMTGKGIAAAMALGARAAQLGTAFLATPESHASATYKRALLQLKNRRTIVTSLLTGKPARMIENEFTRQMQNDSPQIAPFPHQHFLTKDIRTVADKQNQFEWLSLYAGQGFPLASNRPTAEIIPLLVQQTILAIQNLHEKI
ncbi:MAG: nitronate monooxygenase [Parachlamydiales bacterium]|nr:nitronate monooxygenase [Candidatus Acheromyda pituitae]